MSDIEPTEQDLAIAREGVRTALIYNATIEEAREQIAQVIAYLRADVRRLENIIHGDK